MKLVNNHKLHIIVVNLDNLQYTKDCIGDLCNQIDTDFDLTLIDNYSREDGTQQYFNEIRSKADINTHIYTCRIPLNHIWNEFYYATEGSCNEFLCFLNNDVRIGSNFTKDIKNVFNVEPQVGVVGHVTNNSGYKALTALNYDLVDIRQGWDFTVRRQAYMPIPDDLRVYYGDDWLYTQLYKHGWRSAMILSSPMIHFRGKSGKSSSKAIWDADTVMAKKHNVRNDLIWSGYSIHEPPSEDIIKTFFENKIEEREEVTAKAPEIHIWSENELIHLIPMLTINVVTYERYDDLKNILQMLINQTDPRFKVDVWQDGHDEHKHKTVESFNDPRISYNENSIRQKVYGHDMRHKSLMQCHTELWCTTNDDNYVCPDFVKYIISDYEEYDMIKYAVGMANLRRTPHNDLKNLVIRGCMDVETYSPYMKVLKPDLHILGDVDACSFVVKTRLLQKLGGWSSMRFEGDFDTYDKIMKTYPKIRYINKVLQVHR